MRYNYKPSLKELNSSLKFRSREYLLENTLHGVPYFVDPTRPKWERIIWFILTMTSLGASIGVIATIWEKFQTEPTITGLDVFTEDLSVDFPQVFLCFDFQHLNYSVIDVNDVYIYEALYDWVWGQHITLRDSDLPYEKINYFRETYAKMAPNCNNVFQNCTFSGVEQSCGTTFQSIITPVGICCAFNASKSLTLSDNAWALTFLTTVFPLRLYLMDKHDSGPPRGERAIIKAYNSIEIQFVIQITYATNDIRQLTRRQRQCHYGTEELTLNDCELKCIADQIYKHCQCLPWFLSFPDKAECPLTKYPCIEKIYTDITGCRCTLPCDRTSYAPKKILSNSRENDEFKISLKSWPRAGFRRETRFGYLDLLVSFGGIAGLFLGYSLLTSVELGYYFTLRAYCGAVLDSSRKKQNISTIQVIEIKPRKIDVNPIQYYRYID